MRLRRSTVVRLEDRPANADGARGEDPRSRSQLVALRPDRIVVGEWGRGPEALDMLQAMNTGHEGSLSTCHANGAADALRRLETMVLMGDVGLPLAAVREQLTSALDVLIVVSRRGARRRVTEVAEVTRSDGSARTRVIADGTACRRVERSPR